MDNFSSLKEALESFIGKDGEDWKSMESLENQFKELAKYLFYGGYLTVNGRKRVYLMDLEFYYHEEEGMIKDWIMYHRDTQDKNGKKDYFPLGMLNVHQSGIDITFENEAKKYRAAVLIRGFAVKVEGKTIKEYDTCSTHLYEDLFMTYPLTEGVHVEWVHELMEGAEEIQEPEVRRNVAEYYINEKGKVEKRTKENNPDNRELTENKKYVQDARKWRFIRKVR